MSHLSRFMHTTRAILDNPDAQRVAPNPHQPPIFVRTNFLFVEIDEAIEKAAELSKQIKIARLDQNPARARELNKQLGVLMRQAGQVSAWAEDHFQKDYGNAD